MSLRRCRRPRAYHGRLPFKHYRNDTLIKEIRYDPPNRYYRGKPEGKLLARRACGIRKTTRCLLQTRNSAIKRSTCVSDEGKRILAAIPAGAYKIALCVEGEQFSSEALAARLERATSESGKICLIIGSSHGLSPEVKAACDLRLSVSKLTFPHQMMRLLLLDVLYRRISIIKGTKYHKQGGIPHLTISMTVSRQTHRVCPEWSL